MANKYRKRPVVIEAVQFNQSPESMAECLEFLTANRSPGWSECDGDGNASPVIDIHTLEGTMTASIGDWIIKGVNGEFYPCKPDIFEKTYETTEGASEGLGFGAAIEALKAGKLVTRPGRNWCGMYLWLLPAATVKAEWCREPHLKRLAEGNGGEIECLGSIRMFTAGAGRRAVLTGWTPSQSDMLAEDWIVMES